MTETRYDITGPGILRAMQEAQSANKTIAFVYDHDNSGLLLRVGYFLKDQRLKNHSQHKITWFGPSEIRINIVNTPVRDFKLAALDLEFSHPKDNERHFILSLTSDKNTRVILRNLFRIHKNFVTGFVIQAEIHSIIKGKGKCQPFVRYDHAHGFIHRDMIASDGSKTKHELGTQDTKGGIVLALDEIIKNLNVWLHQLGYKPLDADVISQPRIIQEMNKAKSKLLELHDNPDKINAMKSTLFWLKEYPDYYERIWLPTL